MEPPGATGTAKAKRSFGELGIPGRNPCLYTEPSSYRHKPAQDQPVLSAEWRPMALSYI